ncbi:MAG: aminotransferase class IV [Cohaesibacter sp.]|jgi:branched-chain amino acid aminotransferase|nr:aminotransferase class IV [Cohaesibacter sp.]
MPSLPPITPRHRDPKSYPPGIAFMDDQFLPMSEAKLSVLDYGFLHSDATYDVVHVWDGAFFRLDDHIERFFAGLEKLHMAIPYDRGEVRQILHDCVALSGLQKAYVEFICTRGFSPDFSRDPRDAQNQFLAFAIPLGSVANQDQMQRGLHLAISDIVRIPPSSLDATIKNYHWLDLVQGLYAAYGRGAETVVLKDDEGNLAEGPGFNLFVIKDGAVATPVRGILHGITRQSVFDVCDQLSLACTAQPVSAAALLEADEAFITSTAGGVMPVSQVNGQKIGKGEVGALTKAITKAYWQLHKEPDYRLQISYP